MVLDYSGTTADIFAIKPRVRLLACITAPHRRVRHEFDCACSPCRMIEAQAVFLSVTFQDGGKYARVVFILTRSATLLRG